MITQKVQDFLHILVYHGKYIVVIPNVSFITISQKIDDETKKKKLIEFVKKNLPDGYGAVIRTSSEKVTQAEIKEDIEELIKRWKGIEEKFNKSNEETELLWESEDVAEKIIVDLNTKGLEKVITNNKDEYNKLSKKINKEKVEIILDTKQDLLSKYELKSQIEKKQNRKIWLNCGGFIIIDRTEALTAIDVNTGKFTGKTDLESTIFKVNKEATAEIAKQIRLRDIGGIIIIDYIDMKSEENKNKIINLLKDTLKEDRAKTQVEGFTKLNLMEMTRKHICSHLNEIDV